MQEEVTAQFQNGKRFFALPDGLKQPLTFNPDLFMGWRSRQDTKSAVGEYYLFASRCLSLHMTHVPGCCWARKALT